MGERVRRRLSGALAAAMAMLMLSPQIGALTELPDEMVLGAGSVTVIPATTAVRAEATGAAVLLGFGSGNPITDENYSKGQFTSYQGKALAVLRTGYEAGEVKLTVSADGLEKAEICLQVK